MKQNSVTMKTSLVQLRKLSRKSGAENRKQIERELSQAIFFAHPLQMKQDMFSQNFYGKLLKMTETCYSGPFLNFAPTYEM